MPSVDCTCGIYATDEPDLGWLERRYLRDRIIVNGFVRLSGKVVVDGPVYRAERGQIVGPLTVSLPPRRWLRSFGGRAGVNQTPRRVVRDGERYVVRYSSGRRGLPVGEWCKQVGETLSRRYAVEVVGLMPPLRGLEPQ